MAAKNRSPNFPALSLRDAIEKARTFYKIEGKAAVAVVSAVKALGYNSLNGRSLRVVGSLKQYGLLEYPATGTVKLTTRALNILLRSEDSPEYSYAIHEAAHEPATFGQLMDQYPDGLPSDRSMIAGLVAGGNFTEAAASGLIAAFRDTMALVQGPERVNTSDHIADAEARAQVTERQLDSVMRKEQEKPMLAALGQGNQPYDLTLPLIGGGQVIVRASRRMSDMDYELLMTVLKSDSMKKALTATPPETPPEVVK